jgi:hypothetical protein
LRYPFKLDVEFMVDAVYLIVNFLEQFSAPGGFPALRPFSAGFSRRAFATGLAR